MRSGKLVKDREEAHSASSRDSSHRLFSWYFVSSVCSLFEHRNQFPVGVRPVLDSIVCFGWDEFARVARRLHPIDAVYRPGLRVAHVDVELKSQGRGVLGAGGVFPAQRYFVSGLELAVLPGFITEFEAVADFAAGLVMDARAAVRIGVIRRCCARSS